MNWREVNAEAEKLFREVKQTAAKIDSGEEVSAEELEHTQEKLDKARELQAKAMQLQGIEKTAVEFEADLEQMQEEAKAAGGPSAARMLAGSEFKNWGSFLTSVWLAGHPRPDVRRVDERLRRHREKERKGGHEAKQMVENVGASGGFLVPTEFLAQLQAAQGEDTIVRRNNPTVIRMARRQIDIPVLSQTGTTSGQPHWFGGMVAYWEEEAAEKTITTPSFRKVTLTAHKLGGGQLSLGLGNAWIC